MGGKGEGEEGRGKKLRLSWLVIIGRVHTLGYYQWRSQGHKTSVKVNLSRTVESVLEAKDMPLGALSLTIRPTNSHIQPWPWHKHDCRV